MRTSLLPYQDILHQVLAVAVWSHEYQVVDSHGRHLKDVRGERLEYGGVRVWSSVISSSFGRNGLPSDPCSFEHIDASKLRLRPLTCLTHKSVFNMPPRNDERQPLLRQEHTQENSREQHDNRSQKVEFDDKDSANPRQWPLFWKYAVVFQITLTAFFLPMASSIFAPAGDLIAEEFGASKQLALLNQSGFVAMLGVGPLFLAPMSETFGRRTIYLICLAVFSLLQIPCALAPNLATFVTFRTLSGLFGSVGVGNGGGSIADMFEANERAKVLGFYMIAPLLAPSVGPAIGGIIVSGSTWRSLAWLMLGLAGFTTIMSYFFMYETRAITILQQRKSELEKKHPDTTFHV